MSTTLLNKIREIPSELINSETGCGILFTGIIKVYSYKKQWGFVSIEGPMNKDDISFADDEEEMEEEQGEIIYQQWHIDAYFTADRFDKEYYEFGFGDDTIEIGTRLYFYVKMQKYPYDGIPEAFNIKRKTNVK